MEIFRLFTYIVFERVCRSKTTNATGYICKLRREGHRPHELRTTTNKIINKTKIEQDGQKRTEKRGEAF